MRSDLMLPTARVDERDTMFARAALEPGTEAYQRAYVRRPDLKEVDDALRALPRLCQGGAFFDAPVMAEAIGHFEAIEALAVAPAWVAAQLEGYRAARDGGAFLKALALELGAVAAGWTSMDKAFIYSHKGRFPEDWGREVRLDHPRVLVFLVEMDFEEMQKAPRAPTIRESAQQYFRAARISLHLEALLRAAGHGAKHHYDAHYDVILPPLAELAGLGELGRNNILIADRFGGRVRIGAVTTDAPAALDAPRDLGVQAFCEVCKKCAENCPSQALSLEGKVPVLGVPKWPTQVERCYRYWRKVGTDCGICMAACPFSHRNNAFHNLVRWTIRTLPVLNPLLVWADAGVYGRKWRTPTKG